MADGSEVFEFGSRSPVSIPSMASEPASPRRHGNQNSPFVPLSHPFVERLIGTIRRECLDQLLFWTAADLEVKLSDFKRYYNHVS